VRARQVVFLTSHLNAGAANRESGAAMKKYKFKATVQPGIGGGAGIVFPYDVEREFGTRARVPVKSILDGVPYSGSLVKCGATEHMLGVLKAIREKIGKGPGDIIEVVVWKDEDERTVEVPAEFKQLMKNEGLLKTFEKLSYTHRKEYCRWITEAKKEETRSNRMAKAVDMLRGGVKTPG
jgi:bifunctional DNA-binding transcriptional regulator/antitoxin component of YhaV-PrlF toxin-antitoxin module